MKPNTLYLLLAIPGLLVPWWFLAVFLTSGEATPQLFFSALFVNAVAGAVSADLLISALVYILFVHLEGRRLGMTRLWRYPLLALLVGLSFSLPLFLAARARQEASHAP